MSASCHFVILQTSTPFPWPYLSRLVVHDLSIFIDDDDKVDKLSTRPSVVIMWLQYLVVMMRLDDLIGPALHTLGVTRLHPHQ